MTDEPPVRVQLLGSFAISLGAKTAGPWPRLSAKRLVALVFLSPRRRISREVASDTLFRDLAPRAATNAMYNALSAARAVLVGTGRPGGRDPLHRPHPHLHPRDAPVVVDLELHECALRAALGMAPGEGRDAALVDVLSEHECSSEDEAYADWALRPRESLELARQEARLALARDRSSGFGQAQRRSMSSKRGRRSPPTTLPPRRPPSALMSAYAAQGQRHLVARAYRRCCDGLEELGLEPSVVPGEGLPDDEPGAWPCWPPRLRLMSIEPTSNLPTFPSSFVGRETEQAEVGSLVRSWRLVTVTGAGGSGKTRLAVEVAARLAEEGTEGTFFVELAPVSEPGQVPAALASATGVLEQPGRPLLEVLAEALGRPGPPRRHGQLRARHRRRRRTG